MKKFLNCWGISSGVFLLFGSFLLLITTDTSGSTDIIILFLLFCTTFALGFLNTIDGIVELIKIYAKELKEGR